MGINGQALCDSGAGLVETVGFFEEDGQADAGVDAAGIGGGGADEAGAGLFRAAGGLELMADDADEFGVARFEVDGFAPGAVGQVHLAGFEGGVAALVPKDGGGRGLAGQFLVKSQGAVGIAGQEIIPWRG